ncbi:MAG TPA: TatD family hydrolase, partial [Kaistella sp.]|nr:TatD family hydrolase [Kaistella sp.]
FEKQIFLANEIQKPLIIHCVRRFSQLIPFRKKTKVPMIVHGFNKRKTIGDDLLKHDFYLSFGKSVLQNVNLQDFVRDFPIEKMFLETDSADFDIKDLYEKVAEIKNLKLGEFNQKIMKNLHFLNIPS